MFKRMFRNICKKQTRAAAGFLHRMRRKIPHSLSEGACSRWVAR